jgi:hypothetical protein
MFFKISTYVFLVVLATAFMYASIIVVDAQVVTKQLVSYWSFDRNDIKDKTVKDLWGNNDGVIMGDFSIVTGQVGEALNLPGLKAGVDYVEIAEDDSLDPPNLTCMAWIKLTAATDYGNVISHDDGSGLGHCLQARGATDTFRMWVVVGGVIDNAESSTKVSSCVGKWTHLAGSYDGKTIRLYVNGVLDASKDKPGKAQCTAQTPLAIGGQFGGNAGTNELINGLIDEACIYNRALSEDEIAQNMNAEGLALNSTGKLAFTWGEIKAPK